MSNQNRFQNNCPTGQNKEQNEEPYSDNTRSMNRVRKQKEQNSSRNESRNRSQDHYGIKYRQPAGDIRQAAALHRR